tara:strand:+ start:653 stop:847 length:195 start_codon:yes stop_codon:yes gene_type:complete
MSEDVEKIINYLILKEIEDLSEDQNPNTIMKIAFIKSRKKFDKLSKKDKEAILKIIENGADGGT